MMSRFHHLGHLFTLHQQSRFLISGGLATTSHWLSMTLLVLFGASALSATIVGSTVGAFCNYWLQKHYTFESHSTDSESIPKYIASSAVAWCMNFLFFLLLQAIADLGVAFTQALTSLLVAFFNYHIYKRFVFHVSSQP